MMKPIIIIGITLISMMCHSYIVAIDDNKESLNKERLIETSSLQKYSISFHQGEIMRLNFPILKNELSLTKKQVKKISKKYEKYLKNQLKIKEKIVGKKVKLSRLMRKRFYDDFEFEDIINDIFNEKKKMYKKSVFFIKELDNTLKKEKRVLFRELVPELYNPSL